MYQYFWIKISLFPLMLKRELDCLEFVFVILICKQLITSINYFLIQSHGVKGWMLKNSQTPCWYPDPSIMEEQNLEVPIVLARGHNLKKSYKNNISSLNAHNFWYFHKNSNFVRNLLIPWHVPIGVMLSMR